MYTALYSFEPVLRANTTENSKILALPLVQETSDIPCDIGSEPEVLMKEFINDRALPVDLGLVEKGWNIKVLYLSFTLRPFISN